MVINQSLVARTFGSYLLQIVNLQPASFWVPALGVGLLAVAFGVNVAGNLTVSEIVAAEDYSLAEAARPAVGEAGVWFTVALAIVATASGVMASIFAASRMLAMLTHMTQVPHRHFGMPGNTRAHTTAYTVVFAMALAAAFDLRRIAALGAVYYLLMDLAIHWGLLRHLRNRVEIRPTIVVTAVVLDVVVLGAFVWVKASADTLGLWVAAAGIVLIVAGEQLFMRSHTRADGTMDM
jgi:amino acid transporter